jgi:mRNA interferase MazF
MKKDFKKWHDRKSSIHNERSTDLLYVKEREIWWCSLGANVGFEQDGKGSWYERPILIFKKFSRHLVWAIPLSTKMKKNPYYIDCPSSDNVPRMAIISQMRMVDTKRFNEKMGFVSEAAFANIKKAVVEVIAPSPLGFSSPLARVEPEGHL